MAEEKKAMTPDQFLKICIGLDDQQRQVLLERIFQEPTRAWYECKSLTPFGAILFSIIRLYSPALDVTREKLEEIINPGMSRSIQ